MKKPGENEMEKWKETFIKIFKQENIPSDQFEVHVSTHDRPGRYWVLLVWDGFDPMSVTTRQTWVWERFRKIVPKIEERQGISMVRPYSVKEFIEMEELTRNHAVSDEG